MPIYLIGLRATNARRSSADIIPQTKFPDSPMNSNDPVVPSNPQPTQNRSFSRLVNRWVGLIWGVVILVGLVFTGDRIYWVNADTYPLWRAEDLTITEQMAKSDESYGAVCVEGHAELMEKKNGNFMRCAGGLFSVKTYRITNYEQMSAWIWSDVKEAK